MSSAEEPQFLRISEVLAMLGICKSTYYEIRKQGLLGPAYIVGKRGVRHPMSCVVAYMESRPAAD